MNTTGHVILKVSLRAKINYLLYYKGKANNKFRGIRFSVNSNIAGTVKKWTVYQIEDLIMQKIQFKISQSYALPLKC